MTTFRILGPIEAWGAQGALPLGGRLQLKVFALLLLQANRAVARDALIEAVWGSERTGAENRLQMTIARLRKALAPLNEHGTSPVRTVGGGYLLSVRPAEIDAEEFGAAVQGGRAALETGDPRSAADLLSSGLALWRGPPLAEVAFEDFAQSEIRRLEELRLTALEIRIDADLQLGRHRDLVSELEALRVAHPLREHFTAQLMLSLYRCGRQSDALELYQRARVELAEQVGLEPGPALKALQAEVLAQSVSLVEGGAIHDAASTAPLTEDGSSPGAVTAPLPSRLQPHGPAVFVNRQLERETLMQALGEATSAGRGATFITGEPGIGKTRLVSEIANEAQQAGTLVLGGRCDEGLDLPYQPFVEVLEHLIEHAPTELLADHVAHFGDSIARLVPGLALRISGAPAPMSKATESERYVLFRAIEGLLASASPRRGMLLVLEDLHWADLPTLKLLRQLLFSPRTSNLMLLCTCRLKELSDDHPLRELIADMHREPHVGRLELRGLSRADVADLVTAITDSPRDSTDLELAHALEVNTNGNPFFITELVRSLFETGGLVHADGRWRLAGGADVAADLPLTITETLASRLRRMGEAVRRYLRVAAVVGEEFDADIVSELSGGNSAFDALDHAVRGGVLVEVSSQPARFRFAHALMQRYLYVELGAARRADLHRRVALATEARVGEGRWPIAELARHWVAADSDAEKALKYAVLAGDEALDKLAPDEARRWYRISLEVLGRQPDARAERRCELLVRLGEAERQAGERRFRETLLEAAELAQSAGDARGLVQAALANTRGMQSESGVVDEPRIDALDAALAVVGDGDSPERARLLAIEAAELMYSPDWDRRTRLSDEALAIARRLGDVNALSTVLNMRFVSLLAPHTLPERQANAVEGVAAAERVNDPLARFYAYHWRGYASIELGDIAAARSWMMREREIAERFRQPTTVWLLRTDEANLAIIAGDLEAADRLAAAALEAGRQSEPDALACYAAHKASIAFESGQLGHLIPTLEQAVKDNPGIPGFRATLALAFTENSRHQDAEKLLLEAASSNFRDLPYDVTWLAVACIYAHVSARLAHLPTAGTLYDLLEPWENQIAFPAFGVWGPVGLYLGSLALAMGDLRTAERQLARAARAAARANAPLWKSRVAERQGRLAEQGA